jgi:polyisoprenoid-binding protein YceI
MADRPDGVFRHRNRSDWPARCLWLCLGLLLGGMQTAHAQARSYELDPVHTRVWFEVEHLGMSQAMGSFAAPRGVLWLDRAAPQSARVEAEIDLATLDLGDPAWNRRMAKRDGFDSAEHPIARFRSTRVEVVSEKHWQVHGVLQLRGVEQPIVLQTRFNRAARHPLTLRRTVGFSATAELSRKAFGMDAWASMVSDRVLLRIEVEARRARAKASATLPAPQPSAADGETASTGASR